MFALHPIEHWVTYSEKFDEIIVIKMTPLYGPHMIRSDVEFDYIDTRDFLKKEKPRLLILDKYYEPEGTRNDE